MVTGDAAVNPTAPVICATAEILANLALREGAEADIDLVIMDEFHYYADRDRGWAWQVPLLELPRAQFLLMSATLGDVERVRRDLERRTGRSAAIVAGASAQSRSPTATPRRRSTRRSRSCSPEDLPPSTSYTPRRRRPWSGRRLS